ncbi:hypothetical protein F2P81_009915 [Scophthalmus maximus]|uniref:Uncharacterized protein n=1 Tax=Scophthalmus maximus TaxID=52904 RepID=A0A6A4T1C0_SCOMX|nr:hypothetical protein F2P81_009915 [Scophthalmus maximus]
MLLLLLEPTSASKGPLNSADPPTDSKHAPTCAPRANRKEVHGWMRAPADPIRVLLQEHRYAIASVMLETRFILRNTEQEASSGRKEEIRLKNTVRKEAKRNTSD